MLKRLREVGARQSQRPATISTAAYIRLLPEKTGQFLPLSFELVLTCDPVGTQPSRAVYLGSYSPIWQTRSGAANADTLVPVGDASDRDF